MNITPEKYIEELKKLRQFIRWTNKNIDTAIDEMQGRLETGYEFKEDNSKMAVKTAQETAETIVSILNKLQACFIEY